MALEIANAIHAAGSFVPVLAPAPLDRHIISSIGFKAEDPNTTALTPLGGFTYVAMGQYLMQLDESIDTAESVALASSAAASVQMRAVGVLPSIAPFNPDNNFVAAFAVNNAGNPADPTMFQLMVFRYCTGPRLYP